MHFMVLVLLPFPGVLCESAKNGANKKCQLEVFHWKIYISSFAHFHSLMKHLLNYTHVIFRCNALEISLNPVNLVELGRPSTM